MSAEVPRSNGSAQFLFTASPNSPLLSGFKINADGSLTPVPGSPFVIATPARAIVGVHDALLIADGAGITVFSVDMATGAIRQTDSAKAAFISDLVSDPQMNAAIAVSASGALALRVVDGRLQAQPAPMTAQVPAVVQTSRQAILDVTDHFMYVIDIGKTELMAFRTQNGKPLPLSPQSYPLPKDTAFITLVGSPRIQR
jgi:hypothetical protein